MTKKLTPQEAWEHIGALWPDAVKLSRDDFGTSLHFGNRNAGLSVSIDWPEGVDQWPPKEPVYETPSIQQDWGKECEFSDDNASWIKNRTLCGYIPTHAQPWICSEGYRWGYCRINCDPAQTKTPGE